MLLSAAITMRAPAKIDVTRRRIASIVCCGCKGEKMGSNCCQLWEQDLHKPLWDFHHVESLVMKRNSLSVYSMYFDVFLFRITNVLVAAQAGLSFPCACLIRERPGEELVRKGFIFHAQPDING